MIMMEDDHVLQAVQNRMCKASLANDVLHKQLVDDMICRQYHLLLVTADAGLDSSNCAHTIGQTPDVLRQNNNNGTSL